MKQPLLSRPSLRVSPARRVRPARRVWIIACLLLLGLLAAMPATRALAAAPAQPAPTAEPVIYQSAELPSASSPGRVITLALDGEGGATMSTDFMNGEDPVVEVGSYVQDGDQLSLTLTGRTARSYETPVEIVFTEQADGSLEATEYDLSLFGSEGLTLLRAEPTGDTAAAGASTTGASTTGASTVVPIEALVGAYSSGTMASADTPGLEMTLTLNADGSATVSTDSMNDEPPYEEVGNWALNEDATVTLNLTGQVGKAYDTPQVIEMNVLPDGSLKTTSPDFYAGKGITFTPVLGDPAGVYVSQIVPAASSPGMVVFMILYENGDVQASTYYLNNEPPVQETGVWTENVDSSVTVTVTASAETTYDQPQQLVFQRSRDTLSFLSLQLARIETAPASTGPTPTAWFQTDEMPAASSPGIQKSLILYDDNSVQMITDSMNGEPPIVEVGDYVDNDDGTLTVTLTGRTDRTYDSPDIITLAQDADKLTATAFDESIYGADGLNFTEQPLDDAPADESAAPAAMAGESATMTETVVLTGADGLTGSATPSATAPVTATGSVTATRAAAPYEAPSGAVGVYATDVLPAASSPGMQLRLVLFADNSAQMITDSMNGEDPIIELGNWTESADGNITVTLLGRIANVYETPVEFVFAHTDTGLNAVEYDTAMYGNGGLTFNTEFEA